MALKASTKLLYVEYFENRSKFNEVTVTSIATLFTRAQWLMARFLRHRIIIIGGQSNLT